MKLVNRWVVRSVSYTIPYSVTEKKFTLNYRYVQHRNKDTPHHSWYKIKLTKKIEQ
jgi:hypothetical protein